MCPENLVALERMLHIVDVFSPHLHEAASFYGLEKAEINERLIRDLAERSHCKKGEKQGVLRCGERGCFIRSSSVAVMLPAYHIEQDNVVEVTCGGNSFFGAFITALELSGDWLLSCILTTVASDVVEKLGMQILEGERWNKKSVTERLEIYSERN